MPVRFPRLSNAAIAGLAGIVLMVLVDRIAGQDYNWDLLNYHYVSPRLLLAGEYGRNVAPSGLQSWFNPIGYVPAYWLILTLPPWLASALLAAAAGLNGALVFRLAERVGEGLPPETRNRAAFACTAIGLTGAITLSEAGTTFLDAPLALLVLGAVLAALRAVTEGGIRRFGLAGLLLGLACGLKLTCIVMAVGMAAALLGLALARAVRPAALPALVAGGLAGFLVTGGWWAWRLWRTFGNPTFPLFNQLFRSPYAPVADLTDKAFLPEHWTGMVGFPWHWLLGDAVLGAEIAIRDPRYAVALVACVAIVGLAAARRRGSGRDGAALLLAGFFLATYLAWLFLFAILRYAVVLEMLSGVVVLGLLRMLPGLRPERLWRAMIVAAFAILIGTRPAVWGRVPFTADWFGVTGVMGVHRPGTVYVLPDDAPLGFLVNAIPDDARFVRIGGNFPLEPGMGLGVQARAMIAGAPHLRSLASAPTRTIGIAALARFGLAVVPGSCRIIGTKAADVESCALARR